MHLSKPHRTRAAGLEAPLPRLSNGDGRGPRIATLGAVNEPDSKELIERAKAGDAAAMDQLIRAHIGGLHLFVRSRIDPLLRHHESSSDLVQTVCREAIGKLDRYEWQGEGSFRGWLFTMALNKLRDRKKFYTAQQRDVARDEPASIDRLRPEDLADARRALTSPTQHAIREELVDAIEATLELMPQKYREVILLSRIAGLGHEQVAGEMDTTPGNVRVLLHRALARLASELHPSDTTDGS
jgi:RNA polymerase sigma-70 factor, ECF subfamily